MRQGISNSKKHSLFWRCTGIVTLLLVWEFVSILVASTLILPGPIAVLQALVKLSRDASFWLSVGGSFLRVLEAFGVSIALGVSTGILSGIFPEIRDVLSPIMTGIRATPVLALILLAMFWFTASQVPVFSAVLMAFPLMHTAAESGVLAVDEKLLQMSHLFSVPWKTILLKLRFPSAMPYILTGAKNALGLSWKVIVAGEVLSQPRFSLGTGMQEARLSLETPSVFAWALTTIVLCGVTEYLFGICINKWVHPQPRHAEASLAVRSVQ